MQREFNVNAKPFESENYKKEKTMFDELESEFVSMNKWIFENDDWYFVYKTTKKYMEQITKEIK